MHGGEGVRAADKRLLWSWSTTPAGGINIRIVRPLRLTLRISPRDLRRMQSGADLELRLKAYRKTAA